MKRKSIFYLLLLFLLACNNNKPSIVIIGKTHKIISDKKWENYDEISFFWSNPIGPEGHNSEWIINNNTILITPSLPGKYTISLSIETTTGKIIGNETFEFMAIENVSSEKKEASEDKEDLKKDIKSFNNSSFLKEKSKYTKTAYSIQISSWRTNSKAIKEKQKLTTNKFNNVYIKKFSHSKEHIFWRVRIGPYYDTETAQKMYKTVFRSYSYY